MYLIDTNVISEARKGRRTNPGVSGFFANARRESTPLFLSVITIGELRRGVDLIRYRGDIQQAHMLEGWLTQLVDDYSDYILDVDAQVAQVWGRLRVPRPENALDKQIAATAMVYGLTVVTRNGRDFADSGVSVLNPFVS